MKIETGYKDAKSACEAENSMLLEFWSEDEWKEVKNNCTCTFILILIKFLCLTFQIDGWIRGKEDKFIYLIDLTDFDKDGNYTWTSGKDSSLDVSTLWKAGRNPGSDDCGMVVVYLSEIWTVRSREVKCDAHKAKGFVCQRRGKGCTQVNYNKNTTPKPPPKKVYKKKNNSNKRGRRGRWLKRAWNWAWKRLRG